MLLQTPSAGASSEARLIARAAEKQNRRLRESEAFSNAAAFHELGDVWSECQEPNWDGYQARPVLHDTLRNAYRLLEALPLGFPLPSIGAEPDGELTMEWHRGRRRTLSVSVTEDGDLHYAALIGPKRHYGTVPFFGDVPEEIRTLIERVTGA